MIMLQTLLLHAAAIGCLQNTMTVLDSDWLAPEPPALANWWPCSNCAWNQSFFPLSFLLPSGREAVA